MNKKILVLGGGVAGSSIAHYLSEKGYAVTVIEQRGRVGGLARTCYYSGHPYEFGPHIWFWPGGEGDPVNNTIVNSGTVPMSSELEKGEVRSRPRTKPS